MRIAFKKNPTTLATKAVCWWTKSPFYHCEIEFSNGMSFSAAALDRPHTRFKKIDYMHKPEEWELFELPFSLETEYKIYEFCIGELGCGYDWSGIFLTQLLPLSYQSRTRWFCSEICMAALQQGGWFAGAKAYQQSPGELYRLVQYQLSIMNK